MHQLQPKSEWKNQTWPTNRTLSNSHSHILPLDAYRWFFTNIHYTMYGSNHLKTLAIWTCEIRILLQWVSPLTNFGTFFPQTQTTLANYHSLIWPQPMYKIQNIKMIISTRTISDRYRIYHKMSDKDTKITLQTTLCQQNSKVWLDLQPDPK